MAHHFCCDPSDFCPQEISHITTHGVPLLITSPLSPPSDCILVPRIHSGFLVSGHNRNQVFEPRDGFMVMPAEDWATVWTKGEDSDPVKVGRYSVEERKDRILRYLKKRNLRNFNKTIKYACRKTLADKRVRVRGRFAKNNEPCPVEILMNTTDHNQMMKYEEEYWLEAAIDLENLGQLPYLGT